MANYNSEFFDEFKRLDKLCTEIYGRSAENKLGVTLYLEDMASKAQKGRAIVPDWASDYNRLRRLRGIRNELAHSPDTFSKEMCSYADVEFIRSFYSRIIKRTDPLSLYAQKCGKQGSGKSAQGARYVKVGTEKNARKQENRGCLWEVISFFIDLF